jgi:hypothetical protein
MERSRDSVVDIATRLRIGVEVRDISVLQYVRTGCEAHSTSYSMGIEVLFRGKAAGA